MANEEEEHIPAPETCRKDKFPEGLRVLAVDDDKVCLLELKALLLRCRYRVTVTTKGHTALKLLRENKEHNKFDIVMTDVHMYMQDMDGFRLLEIIGLEMDIPVIMMSSNDDQSTVMKGVRHGACDYLVKPIRLEAIKNIWQHVVRKVKFDPNDSNVGRGIVDRISKRQRVPLREDGSSSQSEEDCPTQKRTRIVWSHELHSKFIDAFYKMGYDKAVPSKILELMNVPGLTRPQVASHLQKYRNALKKSGTQEGKVRIASDGRDDPPPNTTVLSFEGQHHNGVNSCNGFGTNGFCSSPMNHFGHHVKNPFTVAHYQANLRPLSLPLNQQSIALQQHPQALGIIDENCQVIKVPGLGGFPSNLIRMENLHQQSYVSRLKCQSFPSEPKVCSGYMEISSNFPAFCESNGPCSSDFPLVEDAVHSNGEDFMRSQMVLGEQTFEHLGADNNFYLNSSSFDDLDAAM